MVNQQAFRFALFAIRLLIGGIFIASSLPKLRYTFEFLSDVYAYEIVGPKGGMFVAMVLPCLELVVGLALVGGVLLAGAFVTAIVLLGIFTVAQASAIHRGLSVSCACFSVGDAAGLVNYASLTRTLLLLLVALAGYVVLFARQISSTDRPTRAASSTFGAKE